MKHLQLKDYAVLIGLNSNGDCVYSEAISLHDYWDGTHVWDSGQQVKRLELQKMFGFLFGSKGNLVQQFESTFDLSTGAYSGGWTRHEDGTLQKDGCRTTGSSRSRTKMRAPRRSRR
jgi:hypothetical protein